MVQARPRRTANRASACFARVHQELPWLGPVIFISSALYFYAQIAVAWVYRGHYSLVTNTISDLGNTACGRYGAGVVCSPRHVLMNVAFAVLGLIMIIGSLLLYHEYSEKRRREQRAALIGFSLMGVGGVGAATVALFPENVNHVVHSIGAALAIGAGNLGIFVLGAALKLPEGMRRSMLLFSSISLTALGLYGAHRSFGIGGGTMERVAAYPETLWLITFGLFIWRFHPKTDAAL